MPTTIQRILSREFHQPKRKMKVLLLIILLLEISYAKEKAIIQPLKDIINSLFIQHQIQFDVFIYKSSSYKASDIINGIGPLLHGKIQNIFGPLTLSRAALIIGQNGRDLQELLNTTRLENFGSKDLKFLIHSMEKYNMENLNIPKPNFDEGHIGHFSYFIIETKKEIQLKTFEWFTPQNCHIQQSVLINTFDKKRGNWKNFLNIEDKFKNFHNCSINVFSRIFNFETAITYKPTAVKRLEFFEMEMMKLFAHAGNFSPIFFWDPLTPSLDIYYLARSNILNDECQVTSIFWEDYASFHTSPQDLYDSFEKIFLTFDYATWICLGTTLAGALIAIHIFSRMPKEIQDLVFGENVGTSSPSLNLVGLFYGLGLTKLPRNNCARILLMTYMLFCLVIGTAYHGVFFELLTTNVTKPVPKTVEELYEKNFTLYGTVTSEEEKIQHQEMWSDFPGINVMIDGMMTTLQQVKIYTEPSEKGAWASTQKAIVVTVSNFKNRPVEIPQKLAVFHFGVGVMKNNFIFPLTDKAMGRLIQNGIPQYFLSYLEKIEFRPIPPDEKEPKVFKLEDLGFGFYIFLVFCGVSFAAFLGEVLFFYTKKFVGLITLLKTISSNEVFPNGKLKGSNLVKRLEPQDGIDVQKSFLNA